MINRPYDIIEQLLNDITRVFAELMGYDTIDALEEIQNYYQEWLGLNRELLAEHSPEELLDFLVKEKEFSPEKIELLAHLLGKEGEILVRNQQISTGKYQIQKALVIFDYVEKQSQLFSLQRRATIDQLTALLNLV